MTVSTYRTVLATALGTSALMWAMPAQAQAQTPQDDSPDGYVGNQADDSDMDGEIIVTARRRDEALQDTPVAITAINTQTLDNRGTTTIGDIQGLSPNLLITNQNSGAAAANLSIRGLTYADVEKSAEPTVGVVIDGVFIGTSTGQFLDFFDIEQVEVLRGPQGTLFGRNTIGGVINIRRTRPTGQFGVKAEASYGEYGTFATRAVVNTPMLGDTVSGKFFYFHTESDGYYTDYYTGDRRGGSNNENYGVAIKVGDGGPFEALLTLEQQEQSFDVVNAPITETGEVFCGFMPAIECNRNTTSDLYTVFTEPFKSTYKAPAGTLEMNLDLGSLALTSITSYRKSEENQGQDFDGSSVDLYKVRRLQNYDQFSQELRAAGNFTDNFDFVIGGYYFNSNYDLIQYTSVFGFQPGVDASTTDNNPQSVIGSVESFAVFGDFNLSLSDTVRVSFGGRYTTDTKELSNGFAQTGLVGQGEATFKKFTPKLGVDWRPNEDLMVYASYSQGFRSGGFSPRAATAATASRPYEPEVVDSFELGTKLSFGRTQFNFAGFYSKYNDLQANTTIPGGPTGNQTITDNVASATIWGLEGDFTSRLTSELTINGALGYLNNEVDGFIVGNVSPVNGNIIPFDYSNNNLIYNPKITGSIGATYDQPTSFGSMVGNVTFRYIDPYDQQISLGPLSGDLANGPVIVNGNDPRVRSDAQTLLDASIRANFEIGGARAYASVFVRNLLDDRGPNAAFTVAGLFSFSSAREPRIFGASLGFDF